MEFTPVDTVSKSVHHVFANTDYKKCFEIRDAHFDCLDSIGDKLGKS